MTNILAGYQITDLIYEGTRTQVYRGQGTPDSPPVILKKLRKEYPTFSELWQFRHQYVLTKNLEIPGIVKPIALEKEGNGYLLVMEDIGGISLLEYMGEKPLNLDEFFPVAIALIEILEKLHQKRIIHKDIKPANILINPESKEIFLIDFSIASLLPKETQQLQNPNQLEGTLAYISPEQTGRMNRGIDYRSDFYGLGVTFYQLLAGQLPFDSTDAMELVHSHIAKTPPALGKRQEAKGKRGEAIPGVLSTLVMKLMAKNAEDRYQSAKGIKHDLEVCWRQWQEGGSISAFELGTRDLSDRFLIPEKLYGREIEVQALLDAFDRIPHPERTSERERHGDTGTRRHGDTETRGHGDTERDTGTRGHGDTGTRGHGDTETRGHGDTERGGRIPASPRHRVPASSSHTPHTPIVLVTGFSGIGKTAVVNEIHKPIVEKRGYFIKGKFDQFNRNIPFSALVQALRDLMGQLLGETDVGLEQWKQQILAALGEQGRVIIEVIPELENIIGPQPEVTELSGSAAQNRFNLLFGKFIRVFATAKHPLVIFLDDLQWADSASLKLMELLMHPGETPYLLLVGAYRDNEVYGGHPLVLTLEEIAKTGGRLNTITLSALSEQDINGLVADTLRCSLEVAWPLTELVYQKAKGNPFFSTQFLKSLYEDGLIYFNFDAHYWQCDIAKVKEVAIADDVVEFMANRISKLLPKTQEVLKLAACIGNQFDLATLAIVKQDSLADTAADLWQALEEGLILPTSQIYNFFAAVEEFNLEEESANLDLSYKFLHDRVQQAAYSLIPTEEKQPVHLKIGKLLKNKATKGSEVEERIFEIVTQLNMAVELIVELTEREELARLNLMASSRAKTATAYLAAMKYVKEGINLLKENCWLSQYELTLALYQVAAEVAYLAGDLEEMENFANEVLTFAKIPLDKVSAYRVQIEAFTAQYQFPKAIASTLAILKLLGIELNDKPSQEDVNDAFKMVSEAIGERLPRELLNLPEATEPTIVAGARILTAAAPAAYFYEPLLYLLIVLKKVYLSVVCGNEVTSPFAYVSYGTLMCGFVGDVKLGYEFGQLALELLSRQHNLEFKGKTLSMASVYTMSWKIPLRETLPLIQMGASSCLDAGDLAFAGYSIHNYGLYSYFAGNNLTELELEIAGYCELLQKLKQTVSLTYIQLVRQILLNLIGDMENVLVFSGTSYDEKHQISLQEASGDRTGLALFWINKLVVSYLFSEVKEAAKQARQAREYLDAVLAFFYVPVFHFYECLAYLAVMGESSPLEQQQMKEAIASDREKLANWAKEAPANFQHKYDLLEAERYRVLGQKLDAIEFYDRAIAGAAENEYIQEEALANELAAKFYLEWGKEKIARSYIIDAYYGYARWGAKAKVYDLEKRYPKLLAPILSQASTDLNTNLTLASISASSVLSSTTGVSTLLDFASAIKASQALSQVLDLEELLSKMMQAVMENAGASKGALLLPVEGSLVIEAIGSYPPNADSIAITSVGRSLPLEETQELPISLINTVRRARKMVVLNHVAKDDRFVGDRYLRRARPQSVLCTPLLNRGKLIAILYLENSLAAGAFTSDRLSLLDILTSQAAISLENARLYQQSQNYSLQLEQYLKQLQEAQLQLVQSEKMATIGQLVAGIAHEINNPVGFISGNLDYASEYLQNLRELLDLYQQGFQWKSATIQSKIEEIELNYLLEDFTELISSMKEGTNRITEISKSMRNFSRSDTASEVLFNLHDGIDSTLLILKHRLKANENRPEIQVVKNYGSLPEVNCYPGQLNQVFMNLIANAIDALEESNKNRSFEEIKSQPNRITITTEIDRKKQQAIVRIADNGTGMSEEVKQKIFDHLFTTKEVGKGTGLGLSISRQIIEEKHGGTLTCTSELGKGTEFAIVLPFDEG